jgi:hypothetical protein
MTAKQIFDEGEYYGCDVKMKGFIIISLVLLAGLGSAYTPEQQITADGMNISFILGIAYDNAIRGQNVTEYNALVDEYNAWVRQHFGEDAGLLKPKMDEPSAAIQPAAIQPGGSATEYLTAPFNTSSDLSKFGKQQVYTAIGPDTIAASDALSREGLENL